MTLERGATGWWGATGTPILAAVAEVLRGDWPRARRPPLWDGRAAGRVADVIVDAASG